MRKAGWTLVLAAMLGSAALVRAQQQAAQPSSTEQVTTPAQVTPTQPPTPMNQAPDTKAPPPQKHAPTAAAARHQATATPVKPHHRRHARKKKTPPQPQ